MKNYLLQRVITSTTLFLYVGGMFAWQNTHSLSLPNTSYLAGSDSTSNSENDMVIEGQLTADGDSIYQYKYKAFDFGEVIYNKSASSNNKRASKARKNSELNISLQKASTDFSGKYVGKIPFTENVSPSGGKVYTIPIITAPGCSFAPQISLTYNSQSGNGVAGYGWNITGVSAINIVGRSIYYDGVTGPIDLSQSDSCGFALDGVRLVSNQGKLTEYQYETAQGFILVKKHLYGGNVAYFTVAYPNGSVATFGFTDNTKTQYTYPLTEITDLKGWKAHFSYIESGNHYFLTKISYGSRNINNHPAEIQLNYEDRSDFTTAYISGKPLALNKLLKSIVSFNNVNGSLQELCTYTLTHELKDVNRLIQLDCSSEGSSLSPLKFAYNFYQYGETNSIQKIDRLFLAQYFSWKCHIRRGKFVKNQYGDGLIAYPSRFDTYTQVRITAKPRLFGSTKYYPTYGSAFPAEQDILIAPGLTFFSDVKTIKAESGFQTIEAVDVDGDGVDEIVKVNFGDLSGSNTMLKITVYKNSVQALTSYTFTVPVRGVVSCEGVTYSPISRLYYFGDFMGTGKAQLLTVSHNKAFTGEDMTSYFALIDLDAKSKISETELFSVGLNNSADILPLDMDGDGKLELCRLSIAGMDVYRFSNKQFIKSYTTSTISRSYSGEKLMFGDMNGDGKIDILVSPEAAKEKIISIPIPVWAPHDCPICKGFEPIIKTDPERDNFCRYNKCDVRAFFVKNLYRAKCRVCNTQLIYDDNSDELYCSTHGIVCPPENISLGYENGDSNWGIYLSTGKGFIKSNISLMKNKPEDKFFLMDINNDGNADLLHLREQKLALFLNKNGVIQSSIVDTISIPKNTEILPANVSNYYSMSHFITVEGPQIICYKFDKDSGKDNLLTTLTDSYGNIYRNEYADMTDSYSSSYIPTTTSYSYPYFSYIGPLNLLRTSGIHTSNYKPQKQYYYGYYGAVMHRTGLGFTGFEKISTHEYIEGVETVEIHNPKMFGVTTQVETPTKSIINSYSQDSFSNKKNNPRIIATSETNKLTNVSIETIYEGFDEYNNPITVKTTYGDLSKLETTVEQHFNYVITSNRYIIGQLSFKEIVQKRNQEYWYTGKELYYNKNNLLQSCINYAIEYDTKRTYWKYDSNGNAISEKSALYNVKDPLGDCYTYDSSGRYLITKTNALGQTTTYSNFDKWGHPRIITDYKNRVTTLVTDSWGNVLSTTSPDGITEATTTAWGGQGLYTVTKTVTGKPTTIVHYDVWEREIRKGNQRFDGQWQFVDNVYDEKGRLEKVSLPFRGTSATYWNIYTYDKYNRPTQLTEASGKTTSWSYNRLSTTETKNGIATTKTYDETGALVKVEDPGGSIVYTLRADGQPKKITAPGNAITSFEYDEYGRKSAIIDPSAGKQTFTENYNADGTCISTVTDAQGRTISTTTDKHGRVKNINRPEFNTSYVYNSDGLLITETSTNGTSTSFTYDNFDRLTTSCKNVPDGKYLLKTFTYDNGAVTSVQYTSQSGNIGTENFVYVNGYNTETKLNNTTTIWKLTEENAFGQPTKATTGALTRIYSYTDFGMPTGRTAGNIQNFTYDFDIQTGNLKSRIDNTRHLTETFGYDNLNRLCQMGTQQIVYEPNGNITQIPSIGSMKYANTAKPYQVTMFTPIGTDVQIRNQQLTYTSFQRPNSIVEDGISASFVYDADGYRVKMNLMQGTTPLLTRYYLDNQYEIDAQKNIERLYLDGDTYSAPAVYIKENGSWKVYYICRDYLGSITHIANADGTLKQELSYDAWGRLRNPSTQVVHESRQEPELFLVRGYTGHEHLALFGLINMNARLYDPVLGRFLSPDPYVQIPNFTQNFNRYSYCLNNPLIYKDENGEWIHLLIGAIIGGAVNWATHGFKFNAKGLGYFAVGAVAGALGAGIGAGISSALPIMGNTAGGFAAGFWGTSAATTATSSFVSGALIGGGAGASSGFVSGIGNGLIDDNNFGIALRQGTLYGIGGAISGALIGGVLSGADAVIHHRNFWNGSKVTNTDVLADAKLPRIIQNSDMNCGPATSEANTGISQNDYRSFLVKNYKYEINQPVRPIDMNNSIEALTGRTVHPFLSNLPKDVEGAKQVAALLNSGHRFIISSGTGTTVNHVTALNKISVLTIQKVSGATVQKVVYQVMNPAGGTFENIGARSMDFIWRISR